MKKTNALNAESNSGNGNNALTSVSSVDFVSDFVSLYKHVGAVESDKCVTNVLSEIYGSSIARAMKFLLDHVSEKVRLRFAHTYLSPESLAYHATASIVIRATRRDERQTRNIGLYAIWLRTDDGQEKMVKFANQISVVFYLMYLIDRRQMIGKLAPINLGSNEEMFLRLYHAVFYVDKEVAKRRFKDLLYREVDGKIRAGRKSSIINDIRRHLAEAFSTTDESFVPYVMTARSHLAVMPMRIVFEGPARPLLSLHFDKK